MHVLDIKLWELGFLNFLLWWIYLALRDVLKHSVTTVDICFQFYFSQFYSIFFTYILRIYILRHMFMVFVYLTLFTLDTNVPLPFICMPWFPFCLIVTLIPRPLFNPFSGFINCVGIQTLSFVILNVLKVCLLPMNTSGTDFHAWWWNLVSILFVFFSIDQNICSFPYWSRYQLSFWVQMVGTCPRILTWFCLAVLAPHTLILFTDFMWSFYYIQQNSWVFLWNLILCSALYLLEKDIKF